MIDCLSCANVQLVLQSSSDSQLSWWHIPTLTGKVIRLLYYIRNVARHSNTVHCSLSLVRENLINSLDVSEIPIQLLFFTTLRMRNTRSSNSNIGPIAAHRDLHLPIISLLHDVANMKQRWSKRIQNTRARRVL